MRQTIIDLKVQGEPFEKGDILTMGKHVKLKVIQKPGKRWYKVLLEIVSFGWYKAPTEDYKCRVIESFKGVS